MKIAVLSDVHSNLEALEAVMADARAQGAERFWCLGDIVGYGADPNPVVNEIAEAAQLSVAGNHDWAACGKMELGYFNSAAAAAAKWTADQLTKKSRSWLEGLPLEHVEGEVRLVHASPSDPAAWLYVLSIPEATGEMESYEEPVCLIGHSHFPGVFEQNGSELAYTREDEVRRKADRRYLVNVGSVGQPRDGDPRAAYLLYDDEQGLFEHRRVEYDVERAKQKILDAGLPAFLANRLEKGH